MTSEALRRAIEPKSDQINADDLLGGDMVVTVKAVKVRLNQEQPVEITLAETAKFYRPGKSMTRVLVRVWGDEEMWIGRSMRLYCDPSVKFGADTVGGIRISEVSHIAEAVTFPLTEKRGRRKMVTIRPLSSSTQKLSPKVEAGRAAARSAALGGKAAFLTWWEGAEGKAYRETGDDIRAELQKTYAAADEANGPSALERRLQAAQEPEKAAEPEQSKAWLEGALAASDDAPEDTNPYEDGSPEHGDWLAGRQGAARGGLA